MFRRGEVYENPATGIKAVIGRTEETEGEQLVVDLYTQRCGAGSVLHKHPVIYERLTVVSGRVGLTLDGVVSIAEVGSTIEIRPGQAHRWWNAGIYEAHVRMDIRPGARFEDFMRNSIGLAQDGKTDPEGCQIFYNLRFCPGSSRMLFASRSPRHSCKTSCSRCSFRWLDSLATRVVTVPISRGLLHPRGLQQTKLRIPKPNRATM